MRESYAAITFLSYADPEAGIRFYHDVLGLTLVEDQGWAKVYRICEGGYVGIVQAKKSPAEPVGAGALLSLTVPDVDAWYEHLKGHQEIEILSAPAMVPGIPVYSFFLMDPAGYHLEIQAFTDPETAVRFGAPEATPHDHQS